jgi:hypothetical protein
MEPSHPGYAETSPSLRDLQCPGSSGRAADRSKRSDPTNSLVDRMEWPDPPGGTAALRSRTLRLDRPKPRRQ